MDADLDASEPIDPKANKKGMKPLSMAFCLSRNLVKKVFLTVLMPSVLASCVSISAENVPTPKAGFATATLAPTATAWFSATPTGLPKARVPSSVITASQNCSNAAILLQDVTIPDNSHVKAGEAFTKTWRLKNTGTCSWAGYTISYTSGERMNALPSLAIPLTALGDTVELSVDLTAPEQDGAYATYFSLQSAGGELVAVGAEKAVYVKVIVGAGSAIALTNTMPKPGGAPAISIGNVNIYCQYSYSENAGYVQELASLINDARQKAGLPALSVNLSLAQAAQGHSVDMA